MKRILFYFMENKLTICTEIQPSDTDYDDRAYMRRLMEEEEEQGFGSVPEMWNMPARSAPPVPPVAVSVDDHLTGFINERKVLEFNVK